MNRNAIEKLRLRPKENEAGPDLETNAYWQGVRHGFNDAIDTVLALEDEPVSPTMGDEVERLLKEAQETVRPKVMEMREGEKFSYHPDQQQRPQSDALKALDALESRPELLKLVSDEDIDAAWFGNFGKSSRREIIADTVLKIGGGWSTGSTAMTICHDLGLITKWQGVRQVNLTKKGKRYLYYCYKPARAALTPPPKIEGLDQAIAETAIYVETFGDKRSAIAILLQAARQTLGREG